MASLRRRPAGPDAPRVPRKDRRGANPVTLAAILLGVFAVLLFLAFTKDIPFTSKFQMRAVFETSNSIRKGSPVRVAGVDVGKVASVERFEDTSSSVVTMEIDEGGLPIHKDATAKIRPRTFLEGNFFVDLRPGSPASPAIADGDTLPVTQTAAPVQFYDVLTSLQASDRKRLQQLLQGLGRAWNGKPTGNQATADVDTRGETAAQSLNDASEHAEGALRGTAIVNEATLGRRDDDLSALVRSLGRAARSLGRNEEQLKDFITNFDRFNRALADERVSLRSTIRELGPTVEVAERALGNLNEAFPSTRAFARELIPGTRETPSTIAAGFPWIRQMRGLLQQSELRGVAAELAPTTEDLAEDAPVLSELLPRVDLLAKCLDRVLLPTLKQTIADPPLGAGGPVFQEAFYAITGVSGETSSFDGNGRWSRYATGGGGEILSMEPSKDPSTEGPLYGRGPLPQLGSRPAAPASQPPFRPDEPCFRQGEADLNGARTAPSPQRTGTPNLQRPLDAVGPVLPTPAKRATP